MIGMSSFGLMQGGLYATCKRYFFNKFKGDYGDYKHSV